MDGYGIGGRRSNATKHPQYSFHSLHRTVGDYVHWTAYSTIAVRHFYRSNAPYSQYSDTSNLQKSGVGEQTSLSRMEIQPRRPRRDGAPHSPDSEHE